MVDVSYCRRRSVGGMISLYNIFVCPLEILIEWSLSPPSICCWSLTGRGGGRGMPIGGGGTEDTGAEGIPIPGKGGGRGTPIGGDGIPDGIGGGGGTGGLNY